MVDPVATSSAHFQFSLRLLFAWISAVAVLCGLAQGLISYLRYVEANQGSIPPETVGQSLFLGFLVVAALVGLTIGPPLCYVVALWRSRR
jgi:hypothetical protein